MKREEHAYGPEILKLEKLQDYVRAHGDVLTAAAISVAIGRLCESDDPKPAMGSDLFVEWQAALNRENQQLVDEGEEPLTVAEFVSCKVQDASFERVQAERLRVERWHRTYNASLTGLRASGLGSRSGSEEDWVSRSRELNKVASADANGVHGMLPPRSKP